MRCPQAGRNVAPPKDDGSFKAALSGDVIVAEKSVCFGFPEILFNLFPGMGAYSFLDRKIGRKGAEDVIASGKIFSTAEMHVLGVVPEDGEGEQAVADLIKQRQCSRNGLSARSACGGAYTASALRNYVVRIWVDAALRLNVRDLKLMHWLASRQNGLGEPQQLH